MSQTTIPGQEIGRPQPQTTVEPSGGPFIRHSESGNEPQYVNTGNAFGALVQQPILARPGYFRGFRVYFQATGGVNGTTTVNMNADANLGGSNGLVANICSLIQFRDPFGTLMFSLPSVAAYWVNLYGGGVGNGVAPTTIDPASYPSFVTASTGASGTGNFSWALSLPFEFAMGIGTLPGANASLQPNLLLQLNASTAVYSTGASSAPGTLPTISCAVEAPFYWLPEGQQVEPPALGTSRQWIYQQCNPTVASAGTSRTALPRMGGYIDTMILEARVASNARGDIWPGFSNSTGTVGTFTQRLQLFIDGVSVNDSPWWKWADDYYIQFNALYRPQGVLAITRKTSMNQHNLGLLDSGEVSWSTNPGSLFEFGGSPWGTFTGGPATVNVILGQIVPRGRLPQGLPEV